MPAVADSLRGASTAAAIALFVLIPPWIAAPLLELTRGERLADTDDPVAGLTFLIESGPIVALTGVAMLVIAAALIVAAAAFERLLAGPTTAVRATAVSAYVAAGLLTLAAALRLSSPGPIAYIAGLGEEWGRTGYLVMHLVGSQGAVPAARVAMSAWMLGVLILAVRRHVLPGWVLALAPMPVVLLLTVAGPLFTGALDDSAFGNISWIVIMVTFLLGVPLWCAIIAAVLLARRGPRSDHAPDSTAPSRGLS